MAERDYRRLARARPRRWSASSLFGNPFAGRVSLWLGKDHLLSVDSTRYSETYKRFYFRDIQAVTLRRDRRQQFWNAFLTLLLVLYLAICFQYWDPAYDPGIMVLQAVLGLFLIVPLAANNLLGPTCTSSLRTAVQIEDLPALSRVWRAQRVLARVRPFIAAAQGELSRDDIDAGVETWSRPAAHPAATGREWREAPSKGIAHEESGLELPSLAEIPAPPVIQMEAPPEAPEAPRVL